MSKIKIPTSFNIELDFEAANLFFRFLAWLLDLIVQIVYILIVFRLLSFLLSGSQKNQNNPATAYNVRATQYLLFLPILLYHLVFEVTLNGQSIGKKLVGIRVISETGNGASFYQFLLRWLLRPFDVTSLGLGMLVLLFSSNKNEGFIFILYLAVVIIAFVVLFKKNKRLGDFAAGTFVIVSRVKSDINDTVFFDLEDDYKPRYNNVLQLSDRDMNIIKTVLDSSIKQKNYELAERTSAKIRAVLKITDFQHPVEFLETVLKDYNYLSNQN